VAVGFWIGSIRQGKKKPARKGGKAATRVELVMEILQTSALPLGYAAKKKSAGADKRETGFEPATATLATWYSTN
jgi:hypothetical protein